MKTIFSLAAATLVFALAGAARAEPRPVSFKEDIKPILEIRCQSCHQPGGEGFEKSGFDVSAYQSVMRGTKFGPMVVPGSPETSNLMVLVDGSAKITMPHEKRKLSTCDRDLMRSWIRQGAKNN